MNISYLAKPPLYGTFAARCDLTALFSHKHSKRFYMNTTNANKMHIG